jgi:hypothetical protein
MRYSSLSLFSRIMFLRSESIELDKTWIDFGPALSGDGVLPRGEVHGRPKSQSCEVRDL